MVSLLSRTDLRTRRFFRKHHASSKVTSSATAAQCRCGWPPWPTRLMFPRTPLWGFWADSICVTRKFHEPFLLLEFHDKHSYRWLTACHNTPQLPFQKEFLLNEVSHLLTMNSFFFSPLLVLLLRCWATVSSYINRSLPTAVGAKCSSNLKQNPKDPRRWSTDSKSNHRAIGEIPN